MPIQSNHPALENALPLWQKARDCYAGEEAVKEGRTAYLAKLYSDQSEESYTAYVNRCLFFEAVKRTVEGLSGAGAIKQPQVTGPDSVTGLAGRALMRQVLAELLLTNRIGLLVDYDELKQVPRLVTYNAEQIINWRHDADGRLSLVVLRESTDRPGQDDYYVNQTVVRFRELVLEEGVYLVRIWELDDDENATLVEELKPLKVGGTPWDKIPMVCVNERGVEWSMARAPLMGLANANLAHYRLSADLYHGLHWTALPTPYFTGVDTDEDASTVNIGSGEAQFLPEGGQAGMLEFTGTGLKAITDQLDRVEKKMAALGARLLEGQQRQVETAEAQRLRQGGEGATMVSLILAANAGLTEALKLAGQWLNLGDSDLDQIQFEAPTEIVSQTANPAVLRELIAMVQSGLIDHNTFIFNLARVGVIPEGATAEEIRLAIDEEGIGAPGSDDEDDDAA